MIKQLLSVLAPHFWRPVGTLFKGNRRVKSPEEGHISPAVCENQKGFPFVPPYSELCFVRKNIFLTCGQYVEPAQIGDCVLIPSSVFFCSLCVCFKVVLGNRSSKCWS